MKHARAATCGLGLVLMSLVAICRADPAPGPQSSLINQPMDHQQLEALGSDLDEEKRAWQNLNNGWGKRGWQDMNSAWGKRGWQNMNSAWGKRGWQDMNSAWGKRAWENLNGGWGKRGWQDMNSAWGKRGWKDMNSAWGKRTWSDDAKQRQILGNMIDNWSKQELIDLLDATNSQPTDSEAFENSEQYVPLHQMLSGNSGKLYNEADYQDTEKRSWSSLHGTWGKRAADKWNNFRGSWGKREPGWNNLKGLWGKRSTLDSTDDSLSDYTDRQSK